MELFRPFKEDFMKNILSFFILLFVILFLGVKSVSAQTHPATETGPDPITTDSEEVVPESGGAIDQPTARMEIPHTPGDPIIIERTQPPLRDQATSSTAQVYPAPSANVLTPEQIRMIQRELNVEGYRLVEDGVMNRETQSALRDYQQNRNIEASGTVNEETLSYLGLEDDIDLDGDLDRSPASVTQPEKTTK